MIQNILIAGGITFFIYIAVEFIKSIRQFMIFKKVRETILISAFTYLKRTPDSHVDLNHLHSLLMKKLSEFKLVKWVREINITWQSQDAIQFIFELEFKELHPKYKFVIGLDDIREVIKHE